MTWGYLIVMVVVLVLGIALAPKPQGPRAAEIEDFDMPTAEEGRPIPVIFGEVDIRGSNVLWYGDLQVKPIRKRSGFSKSTVGHKYYLGWHMGLCHGPVDAVTNILIGEKQAWMGNVTSNGNIVIDKENLFGGEKREGGWVGTINVCMGAPNQTANSYLSSKLAFAYPGIPVPAFRGIFGLVVNRAYIGTSAYPKILAVRTRRILKGWQTGTSWYAEKAVVDTRHMNPAHIVYQCLTDSRWGMGVDTSLIDEASFKAVADKLHAEKFGMSVNWNQSEAIENFIQIVLDHIAGGLTLNNSTGKYEMLLVRGDYKVEDLDTYDESDIIQVIDYQRQGWGETVNEVTLVYTDPRTRKDTTISQQDMANIDAQGTRVPHIVKLKGIHNHEVAQTVLARELVSRVTPLSKIVFEINRRAWAVRYGGLFKLVYAPRKINGTVYRVLKVSKGTLQKNSIRIEALEDIYALGVNSSVATPSDPPEDEIPPITPDDSTDTGANVISTTTTTPPSTPADGDSYLIPGDRVATGAWAGHEGQVADWDEDNQVWVFTDVPDNTLVFDETSNTWHTVVGGVAEDAPWKLPLTTKGDLLVHNGTSVVRVPAGSDKQILTADKASANGVLWADNAGGGGGGGGGSVAGTVILAEVHDELREFVGATTMTVIGDGEVDSDDPIIGSYSWMNNGTGAESTDYVRFEGDATALLFDGDFTWEGWFKPGPQNSEFMMLFSTSTANGGVGDFQLHRNRNSNDIALTLWVGSYTGTVTTTGGPFTPNVWHHVAVTRQGTTLRLFVDGVLKHSVTNSSTFGRSVGGSTSFNIGRGINTDNSDFNGRWQLVRVIKGTAMYVSDFEVPKAFFSEKFLTPEAGDVRYSRAIPTRPEVVTPTADELYMLAYDTVDNAYKKILMSNLPFGSGGGGGGGASGSGSILYAQTVIESADTIVDTTESTAFESKLTGYDFSRIKTGEVFRVRAAGSFSTDGTPGLNFRVKFGSTTLVESGSVTMPTVVEDGWVLEAVLVVKASGTSGELECQGVLFIGDQSAGGSHVVLKNNAPIPVDLSLEAEDIGVSVEWGTADVSNTVTQKQMTVELLTARPPSGAAGNEWDKIPDAPNPMDDEFNTDIGGGFDTSKWSWVNRGVGPNMTTAVQEQGVIQLLAPRTAGDNLRLLAQPVPGTTWKVRTRFFAEIANSNGANWAGAGLAVYNSVNGRFILFGKAFVNTWVIINDRRTANGFSATIANTPTATYGMVYNSFDYFEIEADPTTLRFRLSRNGYLYKTHSTETIATYIGAPTHVGLCMLINSSTIDAIGVFDWFRRVA